MLDIYNSSFFFRGKINYLNFLPLIILQLDRDRIKKKKSVTAVKTHHKSWKLSEPFHDLKSEISNLS